MSAVWITIAVVAALSSQDLRGPLAAIVDLDLAGHTGPARERFLGTEDLIRKAGFHPDLLRPPVIDERLESPALGPPSSGPPFATDSVASVGALNTLLNEHGRDDTARAYYSLLFHARRGERALATEAGARLTSLRNTPRSASLVNAFTIGPHETR